MNRRQILLAPWALAAQVPGHAASATGGGNEALSWLQRGGVVLALRHALAPGTFDPPGFRLGECATQRNLNEVGRAQSRALGERLREAGLVPATVRASPWCRCMETARLAFGRAEAWPALGSPRAGTEAVNAQALAALRTAVVEAARRPGRFDAWVTHMFVLSALVDTDAAASGEGWVLGPDARGAPVVLARLPAPGTNGLF